MSSYNTFSLSDQDNNKSGGSKRTPCPLHGCKRAYTDPVALETHIKDHDVSAESLPGKVLLCSTVGCSGSFPNMQKLMEHMRHHHKPNIFFLCESCRTKLRSYRGLLTHLHTCSKLPKGKTKLSEPAPAVPTAVNNPDSTAMDQNPPQLDSTTQEVPFQISALDGSLAAAAPQSDSTTPPFLGPPFLFETESSPPQRALQHLPLSLNPISQEPLEAQDQHQTQNMSPGVAPHSSLFLD